MGSADLLFILGEAELVTSKYVVIDASGLCDALDQAGLLLDQDVVGRADISVFISRLLLRLKLRVPHLCVICFTNFGLSLYQSCLFRCRLQKSGSACCDQDVFVWSCHVSFASMVLLSRCLCK